MKIILDAMGGDNAPKDIVKGAASALKEIDEQIVLLGDQQKIEKELKAYPKVKERFEIVHCTQDISNEESPVKAVRTKKDSSIVKGMAMVKKGEGDVFISAGNTGAILAGALFEIGRIQGIDRPALGTVYPIIGSKPSFLVDAGANAECKPNNLLEFATMGSIYMEKVLERDNPTVGLVNNGSEKGKGTTLTKATYELLEDSKLNFIGNVEARYIPDGVCDVIVADGFTGNAILKMTEGMGLMFLREMKKRFTANGVTKLAALLLKKQLMDMKSDLDYAEYGGAPILGVKGAVIKMHGSSDDSAVKQTILKAIPFVKEDVVGIIQNHVFEIEDITNSR